MMFLIFIDGVMVIIFTSMISKFFETKELFIPAFYGV